MILRRALIRLPRRLLRDATAPLSSSERVISAVRDLDNLGELRAALDQWTEDGLNFQTDSEASKGVYRAVVTALRFHSAHDDASAFTRAWIGAHGFDSVDADDLRIPLEGACDTLNYTAALSFMAVLREAGIDESTYFPDALQCAVAAGSLKSTCELIRFAAHEGILVPFNLWYQALRLSIQLCSPRATRIIFAHAQVARIPQAKLFFLTIDALLALTIRAVISHFWIVLALLAMLLYMKAGVPAIVKKLQERDVKNAERKSRKTQLAKLADLAQK